MHMRMPTCVIETPYWLRGVYSACGSTHSAAGCAATAAATAAARSRGTPSTTSVRSLSARTRSPGA